MFVTPLRDEASESRTDDDEVDEKHGDYEVVNPSVLEDLCLENAISVLTASLSRKTRSHAPPKEEYAAWKVTGEISRMPACA